MMHVQILPGRLRHRRRLEERATGFEPAVSAWKADALPLGDARMRFDSALPFVPRGCRGGRT